MGILNLDVYEVKQLISLREEYWEYDFDTNCYAFALGLDVPEGEITKKAYQLGVIGAVVMEIPIVELKKMTFEERLFLDLDALGIIHEEVSFDECSGFKYVYDKRGRTTFIDTYWLISLFSSGDDFHFLRKSYNGKWWHKQGYFGCPTDLDSNKSVITNPEMCNIRGYEYVKTYKLSYREKYRSLFTK